MDAENLDMPTLDFGCYIGRLTNSKVTGVFLENLVEDDFAVIVPAGARHNVRNTSNAPLRFYTLYGPPEHKDKIVQHTKAEADKRHPHEEWDGKTTE